MSTTLEAELLQAADRAAIRAQETDERTAGARWRHLRGIHEAEATRLRQRAAWVRELGAKAANEVLLRQQGGDERGEYIFGAVVRWLARLTGPIPAAETAPTERKEP